MRSRLAPPAAVLLLVMLALGAAAVATTGAGAATPVTGQLLPGTACPAFPADNVWNTPVTGLPVSPRSATWMAHMGASADFLHPDFGPSGGVPYGIPWQRVSHDATFTRVRFQYGTESDRDAYPLSARTPIEGGAHSTGDRHAIMVDPDSCRLYELYEARYRPGGDSTAGSGAIWNLRSDALRPPGVTSADAAGLPILPGLVDYDEVMSGRLQHAIRVTAQTSARSFVWPARHEAGAASIDEYPPMGARFRLDASFRLPRAQCSHACQVVVQAMKTYGLIVADNGSNWFFGGTADRRWTVELVDQLKQIPASRLQAVDERCLMIHPGSGAARQPGTPGWERACGARSARMRP